MITAAFKKSALACLAQHKSCRPRRELETLQWRLRTIEPVKRLSSDIDEIQSLSPVVPSQAFTLREAEVAYSLHLIKLHHSRAAYEAGRCRAQILLPSGSRR
jgi:hypothetical protein